MKIKAIFYTVVICMISAAGVLFAGERLTEAELWAKHDELMGVSEGWSLKKDKNGIRVYTRDVDISSIKSFRGVMEVEADLSTLTAFFMDAESAPLYVKMCEDAKVIKKESETDFYMYSLNRSGWPISPRDSICHGRWSQDPETLVVTEKCVGACDMIPEKEGIIRVPLMVVLLKLTPRENGRVEILLETIAESGGWIPDTIVNMFLVDTPFSTFSKIQGLLPLKKYQGKTIPWVKEPSPGK